MNKQNRRTFLQQSVLLGTSLVVMPACLKPGQPPLKGTILEPTAVNGLEKVTGDPYLKNAQWYTAAEAKAGFEYEFGPGTLAGQQFITMDMLADGNHLLQFNLELQEGPEGRVFQFAFGVLNQCSLRVRFPLSLVDQNTWRIPREGAFLKPMCWGDRVDLHKVDRMRFYINRKSEEPARFCMTPVMTTEDAVPLIEHPVLPKGKLLDAIGQSTIHYWPGKTRDLDSMQQQLKARLEQIGHQYPEGWSSWGGRQSRKVGEGTGFFAVHHDGQRWWLVDPEGHLFWSAGIDSVRVDTSANVHLLKDALTFLPEGEETFEEVLSERDGQLHINYLAANFIRTFGKENWRDQWATIALDELKRLRFNTVGNWSEWKYAAAARFPYVRPMSFSPKRTTRIYRDFPDVYHPDFEQDAADYAQILAETADDPALIGYFMMNEPNWAFSKELPAVGMLYTSNTCATRTELVHYLRQQYATEAALVEAWELPISFAQLEKERWTAGDFTPAALNDLEAFSERMVEHYFGTLSKACKAVDPNHLNLGIRYQGVPPSWAVAGMQSFDVFSMNNYREKVPFEVTEEIHKLLDMPVIIGEWHFGALDVGLPASGIGHVRTQADRGKAYRIYLEDAAANPYCVGVHWFVLYDQSALGRFDGENYNIGFLDVCNQPHTALCAAAVESHEAMYRIAEGKQEPYQEAPEYLPKLFL